MDYALLLLLEKLQRLIPHASQLKKQNPTLQIDKNNNNDILNKYYPKKNF
jgi:hypothetical protein